MAADSRKEEIMQEIFIKIIVGIAVALLSWLGERIIVLINSKIKNDKIARYLSNATLVVTDAVKATQQEIVDTLKKEGKFDLEAQSVALETTKSKIRQNLTEQTKAFIEENYGNFEMWMETAIHATLFNIKK